MSFFYSKYWLIQVANLSVTQPVSPSLQIDTVLTVGILDGISKIYTTLMNILLNYIGKYNISLSEYLMLPIIFVPWEKFSF